MIPKLIHYCWYGKPLKSNYVNYRCVKTLSNLIRGGKYNSGMKTIVIAMRMIGFGKLEKRINGLLYQTIIG